jgi:hypothetical protein
MPVTQKGELLAALNIVDPLHPRLAVDWEPKHFELSSNNSWVGGQCV